MATIAQRNPLEPVSDDTVVERVLGGDTECFEIIMRRYNQRLYRVTRSILRDDAEAEDVVQDAYVRAYQNLAQFAGRAKFSTWLTRIAVHEALARSRKRQRWEEFDSMPEDTEHQPTQPEAQNPERAASTSEVRALLEDAIGAIPANYRVVFVMREVEEMSTEETADALDLTVENVKIRLHRAKAALRREIFARAGEQAPQAYLFPATRCDRVVARVFARIAELSAIQP
jgi:RNA polymerase sigma-70 factor, ECF subfamily